MSLFRQLWLAIVGLMIVTFVGSMLFSALSARAYLEEQLSLKNLDNATTMALSLSQLPDKDPVSVELAISAQFDTGHFALIELASPSGKTVIEKRYEGPHSDVPDWFMRLFPLDATPGVAQIQDGWRQFGTLTVVSHDRFAYRELWLSATRLAGWFVAMAVIAGILGTLLIRVIVGPLRQVVEQARAITERRFITLHEPHTPELRSVVRAMNDMVTRLKKMFADEASRLESVRRQMDIDSVTGLANRRAFVNRLDEALTSEDAPAYGALVVVRVSDLDAINREFGHDHTDRFLTKLAKALESMSASDGDGLAARLKGPDFALLLPGHEEIAQLAGSLRGALLDAMQGHMQPAGDLFHIGAVRYRRGELPGTVMAAADQALATAEGQGPNSWYAFAEDKEPVAVSLDAWKTLITDAIAARRLKLVMFPVVHCADHALLHNESMVRLQPEAGGPWLAAGDFMPMARRLKLTSLLDLDVVQLALRHLESEPGQLAINLSADSIADWGFRNRLGALLARRPDLCRRLWVEVAEYGVFQHVDAFRDLAVTLKAAGCKVGIEHFGSRANELSGLADLGLDYLKINAPFVRGILEDEESKEFLRGVIRVGHAMGLVVIAEGVSSREQRDALPALQLDAMTGPAIVAR